MIPPCFIPRQFYNSRHYLNGLCPGQSQQRLWPLLQLEQLRPPSNVAREILDKNGLYDVKVEQVAGNLTDHYDPRVHTVRLSSGVYNSSSLISPAAHETGHAVQHADGMPQIKNSLCPAGFWQSNRSDFIIIGFIMSSFDFP